MGAPNGALPELDATWVLNTTRDGTNVSHHLCDTIGLAVQGFPVERRSRNEWAFALESCRDTRLPIEMN